MIPRINQKLALISSITGVWAVQSLILIPASLGETLPSFEENSEFQPLEINPISPTFDLLESIPPEGYSPPPFEDTPTNRFNRYRLGVGDVVSITVQRFPEFNAAGMIDAEGNMVIPILGRIGAIGLTLEELETKVSYELGSRFLQDKPIVNAILGNPRPVQVTLLGEIFRPGYYTLAPNTPLTVILTSAGGTTNDADLRSVIIRRTLVDGSMIEEKIDLYTPLQTGDKLPNISLQGGDTIIVSRLEVGADQDYDRRLISKTTLAQPTIRVRVLSYAAGGIGTLTVPNGSTFVDILSSVAPNPDSANLGEISLLRFDPEKGGIVSQTLNAQKAIKGDITQNIPLQDEDVVVVGRSLLGKLIFALSTVTAPIQTFRDFQGFFMGLPSLIDFSQD
jgi:polysaccharide biosynthesis/export protein